MNRANTGFEGKYIPTQEEYTPPSNTVEIAGKAVTKHDIIDITNKEGKMVRYKVTNIVLDDENPPRLLLQSIDGKIKTYKDLSTLNKKPDSFRVLTKQERTKLAETEIAAMQKATTLRETAKGLTDDVIDNAFDAMKQPSEAQRLAMAEAEIAAMRTITPKEVVEKELETYISFKETLRKEEERHIAEMRARIANIPFTPRPETFETPTLQSIRDTVAGEKTTLYQTAPDAVAAARRDLNTYRQGESAQIKVAPTEFSTRLAADQAVRDAQRAQTAPSLFGRVASGIRSFFGRKPELQTGASLPRTEYRPETIETPRQDDDIPELPEAAYLNDTTKDSGSYKKAA